MQFLHVDKIKRHMGNGCTEPLLAVLSNGEKQLHAVIKTQDNIQGSLTLLNELVCYKISYALNILMPESGIAFIDNDTQVKEGLITDEDIGACFYSKYIDKTTILNEAIVDLISNKAIYEDIILFDHLVYNKDRNRGNLLITTGKAEKLLYAIDHSHVFKNETIWDGICLEQGIACNDYLDKDIVKSNEYLYGIFNRNKNISMNSLLEASKKFKKVITKDFLDEIMGDIPKSWVISYDDLKVLKKYLLYRKENINEMCEMIAKYNEWR